MAYDSGGHSDKACAGKEGKLPSKPMSPMTKNPFAGKGPKPTPTK
jgi:hypothetical protein